MESISNESIKAFPKVEGNDFETVIGKLVAQIEGQQAEIDALYGKISELEELISGNIEGLSNRISRVADQVNNLQPSMTTTDLWTDRLDKVDKLFLRRMNEPFQMSDICFSIKYGKSDKRYREAAELRSKMEQCPERYRIHKRNRGNTADLVPDYYLHLKKEEAKRKNALPLWDDD